MAAGNHEMATQHKTDECSEPAALACKNCSLPHHLKDCPDREDYYKELEAKKARRASGRDGGGKGGKGDSKKGRR